MAYTGIYERTIFYNPVNKYSVISVKTSDRSIPEKARSAYRHRDNMIHFAAVGYELPRTDQVSMILDGEWKEGKNGFQLHVTKCEEVVPQTREGIKGYLSSRLIKGIGGKTAELIVDRFGADTLHVLENEPERLLEIRGVSKAKLEEIIASYNESRTLRDLMLLLAPFQITPTTATKIYDHFGAHSVDILRDNPFELCQISGFGFKRVDAIMRKNNWPLNSPMRIRGAVFAALEGAKGDGGHLYLDAEQLRKESMALLNSMIPVPQMRVKADDLEAVIDDMLLQGKIINSNGNYYLVKTFAQEDETARSIARLLCRPVERVDVQDLLTRVRRQLGVELSLRQTEAVHMVFRSDLSIITGSPGTGKTTVLKAVIEVFKLLKPSENILLAAPTGRASRRMAESTGVNNASTLHSLLGLFGEDGGFRKGEEDMLDAGLIIVDESSMMDMWLARQFFSRIGPNTKVLLVGDADQLQSVGAGDVFRELIDCGLIPVTVLNEIFRQKKDSLIAYNAQKINNNDTGFFYGNDFTVCKCANQEEAAEHLRNLYLAQVKQYGVDRVQILSPFRSTGAASVDQLNEAIRELVNPQTEEADLKVGSLYYRVGDMTMHKLMRYADAQYEIRIASTKTPEYIRYYSMANLLADYRDYLRMCKEMQYDVASSFILFPRNLKSAHDHVVEALDVKRTAEQEKAIADSFEEWQRLYQYKGKDLMVIPPHSSKELIDEGTALRHCVGRYVKRVAQRECVILFVRKVAEPDKSLCTVEVRDGQVVQTRGFDNEDPPAKIKAFIERWKRQVLCAADKTAA